MPTCVFLSNESFTPSMNFLNTRILNKQNNNHISTNFYPQNPFKIILKNQYLRNGTTDEDGTGIKLKIIFSL